MTNLSSLALRSREAGIFTDFDGVLSLIVPDPADATALPGVDSILTSLAKRFQVVAVVSGRTVADLASRVRASGVRLVGLHGLEVMSGGEVVVLPEVEQARRRVDQAALALELAIKNISGAELEHKGLAITLHFRRSEDPVGIERAVLPIVREIATLNDLSVFAGRRVLEIRPRVGGDKGSAVRALINQHGLKAALFAGDDVGDLPAFHALAGLELALCVAVASDESPSELTEAADIVVSSPNEFVAMLQQLVVSELRQDP